MKASNYISSNHHLTKEVIFQLLNKQLNENETVKINQHLKQCDLCSDAVKGLQQTPDMAVINSLSNKWRKSHRYQNLKSQTINLQSFYVVLTFALIISVALIYLLYFKNPVNNSAPTTKSVDTVSKVSIIKPEVFMVPLSKDSIVENENSSIQKMVSKPESKHDIKVKIDPAPLRDATYPSQTISNPAIDSKGLNEIPKLVIQGFLLRDYTSSYKENKEWNNLKNGVAARFAEDSANSDLYLNKLDNPNQTSYEDVFDAAFRNIKKGKYYKAIDDINFVQQFFPNDLNCFFYKGLCYEYLNDFSKGDAQFNLVINANDEWWNEAAFFHLALCKSGQNQKLQAIKLFQTVIDLNGFYKNRAEEQLKILQ